MPFQVWTEDTVYPRASRPIHCADSKEVVEAVTQLLEELSDEPTERIVIEVTAEADADAD